MKVWLTTPKGRRRKLTKTFVINWLNKIDPGESLSGAGNHNGACNRRVQVNGRMKECGQPGTKPVGKTVMCESCFQVYEEERQAVGQKGAVNAN